MSYPLQQTMAIVSKQHIILYQHLLVRTNIFVIVPGLHNKARLASLTRHLCRTNLSSNMSYKTSSESCAIEGKRPTLKLLTSRPLSYLLHVSILPQKHSQTCKTDIFNNFLDDETLSMLITTTAFESRDLLQGSNLLQTD